MTKITIPNMTDLNNVFRLVKFALLVIVFVILLGLKDTWVAVFAKSPDLGGTLTWAILILFVVQMIPSTYRIGGRDEDD